MRHEVQDLNILASGTGAGTEVLVDRFREKTVQLIDPGGPAFNGSGDIEGSMDGTNFGKLITGVTAAGIWTITSAVKYLRFNMTARVAGTLTGKIGAFDSRTDGG